MPAGNHPGTGSRVDWRSFFRNGEDMLVVLSLAALMALPLAEVLFRAFSLTGLSGSSSFVQHFTLLVGMFGGAIAAREGRLLALSTVTTFLKGRYKTAAMIYSGSVAVAISVLLCDASVKFLLTEKAGGKALAFGIPIWVIQLILPLSFGLIAIRLIRHAATTWKGRGMVLLCAGLILLIGAQSPWPPEAMVKPALVLLLGAAVLGTPIFAILGGVSLILLWGLQMPAASIPLKHYSLVTNPSLPAIPLFTLAGYFLSEGGASRRLVRVFQSLFSQFRGGPAVVTVLVCTFFTTFTGASGVTILALGGLLMPVLLSAGYSERNALGLLTGAGSLGVLFPPCLPLILYAVIAGTAVANLDVASAAVAGISMERMFLGGIGPGIVLVALTAWLGIRQGSQTRASEEPFNAGKAWAALWEAKWEMLMPVVAIGALFGGFATPVEAAAITAVYAFVVETFVYRDLKLLKDVPKVMAECGLLIGGVLLILGVAMGFTHYLVLEQVPMLAVDWVTATIESRLVFLLVLNIFLLMVGCLMDIYSAIVVVVPLIVPIGLAYGIDPVHLGIIFLANLQLGYLTPPVGMNLFLSSYRFNKPLPEVYRSVLPIFFVLLIGVILITYFPPLTTFLPNLFK